MKKKLNEIIGWLSNYLKSDKKTLAAIGEDIRKVAVTAIGVGLVGIVITSDIVSPWEGVFVLFCGIVLWIYGIIITKISNS
jgi:polyferredoxin